MFPLRILLKVYMRVPMSHMLWVLYYNTSLYFVLVVLATHLVSQIYMGKDREIIITLYKCVFCMDIMNVQTL